MSATACARAASDLTTIVTRLGRAQRLLAEQATMPADHFGGLSGDAFRRHAARSAHTAASAASDVALLAMALAALGRALAEAEELRDRATGVAAGPAEALRARAREVERRAQQSWREAMARYEGRDVTATAFPDQPPGQPVVPGVVFVPETAQPVGQAPAPCPQPPEQVTSPAATPPPAAVAPPAPPPPQPELESELESELVTPGPQLESELITPAAASAGSPAPTHCGTTEAIDELR